MCSLGDITFLLITMFNQPSGEKVPCSEIWHDVIFDYTPHERDGRRLASVPTQVASPVINCSGGLERPGLRGQAVKRWSILSAQSGLNRCNGAQIGKLHLLVSIVGSLMMRTPSLRQAGSDNSDSPTSSRWYYFGKRFLVSDLSKFTPYSPPIQNGNALIISMINFLVSLGYLW